MLRTGPAYEPTNRRPWTVAALVAALGWLASCGPLPSAPPPSAPGGMGGEASVAARAPRAAVETADPAAAETITRSPDAPPGPDASALDRLLWADRMLRAASHSDPAAVRDGALGMLRSGRDTESEAGARLLASLGPDGLAVLAAVLRSGDADEPCRASAFAVWLARDDTPPDIWLLAFADDEACIRSDAFVRLGRAGSSDTVLVDAALRALVEAEWLLDDEVACVARGARIDTAGLVRYIDPDSADSAIRVAGVIAHRGDEVPPTVRNTLAGLVRARCSDWDEALALLFRADPAAGWACALETAHAGGLGRPGTDRLLGIAAAAGSDGGQLAAVAAAGLEADPHCFRGAIDEWNSGWNGPLPPVLVRFATLSDAGAAPTVASLARRLGDAETTEAAADALIARGAAADAVDTAVVAATRDDVRLRVAAARVLCAASDDRGPALVWELLQSTDAWGWGRYRARGIAEAEIAAGRLPDWSAVRPEDIRNDDSRRAIVSWLVAGGRPIEDKWRTVLDAWEPERSYSDRPAFERLLYDALRVATWGMSRDDVSRRLSQDCRLGIAAALASGDAGVEELATWVRGAPRAGTLSSIDAVVSSGIRTEAVRRFLGSLLLHTEPDVRASALHACWSLDVVPDEFVADPRRLLADPDPSVRSWAVFLVARAAPSLGNDLVKRLLRQALADPSSGCASTAAWAVGELGIDSLVPDLAVLARFGADEGAWSLGRLGAPGLVALEESLRDARREVAASASDRALGGLAERLELGADAADVRAAADAIRELLRHVGTTPGDAIRSDDSCLRLAALLALRLPADAAVLASWSPERETDETVRRIGQQVRTAADAVRK